MGASASSKLTKERRGTEKGKEVEATLIANGKDKRREEGQEEGHKGYMNQDQSEKGRKRKNKVGRVSRDRMILVCRSSQPLGFCLPPSFLL